VGFLEDIENGKNSCRCSRRAEITRQRNAIAIDVNVVPSFSKKVARSIGL